MKTFYYLPAIIIACICFSASCSTPTGKYDDTITDYILKLDGQTSKISVKIHNSKNLGKILIGNNPISINKNEDKKEELTKLEEQLVTLQDELFKLEVPENDSGREIMETYITKISNLQQQIEYLKTEGAAKDSTEVKIEMPINAVTVQCKYSIYYLSQEKEVIETRSFIVSEDGKTCYGLVDDFIEKTE